MLVIIQHRSVEDYLFDVLGERELTTASARKLAGSLPCARLASAGLSCAGLRSRRRRR
jgi:hypothetical protein